MLDKKSVATSCKRYYSKIGVPNKRFHAYRHTFGTNLCRAGVTIETTSELLGHSDINVTKKYYVQIPHESKKETVENLSFVIPSMIDKSTNM